jgi:hypothetical protein
MADAAEEIEKRELEQGSWARTAKDLFAGAAGGVAQVLLGKSWSALCNASFLDEARSAVLPFCGLDLELEWKERLCLTIGNDAREPKKKSGKATADYWAIVVLIH